jgi:hypothetical protein
LSRSRNVIALPWQDPIFQALILMQKLNLEAFSTTSEREWCVVMLGWYDANWRAG